MELQTSYEERKMLLWDDSNKLQRQKNSVDGKGNTVLGNNNSIINDIIGVEFI
jgi:hypothetical protein